MEYVYGALLLHKTGQAVNEENLKKVVESTNFNFLNFLNNSPDIT